MSTSLQPAIKKEAKNIALYCLIGSILMYVVFLIWHQFYPDKVPFDYTVILGGLGGSATAVLNFVLMGMTVQKVVLIKDAAIAKKMLKFSYTRRFILQIAWCVVAIFVPCFHMIAGLIPLLFPSLGIKGRAIFFRNSFKNDPIPVSNDSTTTEQNDVAAPAEENSAKTNPDNNDDNYLSFREV